MLTDARCGCLVMTHVPTGKVLLAVTENLTTAAADQRRKLRAGVHESHELQSIYQSHREMDYSLLDTESLEKAQQYYESLRDFHQRSGSLIKHSTH